MGRSAVALLFCLSLLPSAFLAWQGRDAPQFGIFHDDSIYVETSRGIVQGNGYRIGSLPWTPVQTKYPPGYPLYLAPAWLVGGTLERFLPVALFLNWLWLPVWMLGIRRWVRSAGLPEWMAVALPVIVALHPEVQLATTRLMSDLMFAALVSWSFAVRSTWVPILAYATRTAALPLLAVLASGRRALYFGAAFLAWFGFVWAVRYPATSSLERYYTDYFGYQLDMVPLAQWPVHAWEQLDPLMNAVARSVLLQFDIGLLSRLAALAAIAGIVRLVRQGLARPFALYGAGATAMLLVWYFPPDARALLPLLPLLLAGFLFEASSFVGVLRASPQRVVAVVLGGIAALVPVCAIGHGVAQWRQGLSAFAEERRPQAELDEAFRWIRENTPEGTQFFAVDDPLFYLKTGRRALRIPQVEQAFLPTGNGLVHPSPNMIEVMRKYHLRCLYASVQHFDPGVSTPLALKNSPLEGIYKSRVAVVACLD